METLEHSVSPLLQNNKHTVTRENSEKGNRFLQKRTNCPRPGCRHRSPRRAWATAGSSHACYLSSPGHAEPCQLPSATRAKSLHQAAFSCPHPFSTLGVRSSTPSTQWERSRKLKRTTPSLWLRAMTTASEPFLDSDEAVVCGSVAL